MRLHLTIKAPSRNGSDSYFIICDTDVLDMDEWSEMLNEQDHVVVTEVNSDRESGLFTPGAKISLNQRYIAKSAPFIPSRMGR